VNFCPVLSEVFLTILTKVNTVLKTEEKLSIDLIFNNNFFKNIKTQNRAEISKNLQCVLGVELEWVGGVEKGQRRQSSN